MHFGKIFDMIHRTISVRFLRDTTRMVLIWARMIVLTGVPAFHYVQPLHSLLSLQWPLRVPPSPSAPGCDAVLRDSQSLQQPGRPR